MPEATFDLEALKGAIADAARDSVRAALAETDKPVHGLIEADRARQGTESPPKREAVLGGFLRTLVAARFNPDYAMALAKRKYENTNKLMLEAVEKEMYAGDPTAGGFLIGPQMSQDVIEKLYARSVVLEAGPRRVDLSTGAMSVPEISSGSTAQYVGEAQKATPTALGTSMHNMVRKILQALVPVSNDLLDFSATPQSVNADDIIVTDLVNSLASTADAALLRGEGTEHTPRGIRNYVPAANTQASAGTTLANIRTDANFCMNALMSNNVPMSNPHWFLSPRSLLHLRFGATDGNNNAVYEKEIAQGRWLGYPFGVTSNIPVNLGGGGNESELIFVDMDDVMVGEMGRIEVRASDQTAYTDADGNLQSCVQNRITLFSAVIKHDIMVRRPVSVAVITAVTWGV